MMKAQMKTEVGERPIIFSGPMVRAILDGRKTQTRRVVKLPSWSTQDWDDFDPDEPAVICKTSGCMPDLPCRYGKPGDRLWLKESFYAYGMWQRDGSRWIFHDSTERVGKQHLFAASDSAPELVTQRGNIGWHKRPCLFLKHEHSRIALEITNVRVERLQEISVADIQAEGALPPDYPNGTYIAEFDWEGRLWRERWNRINGKKHPWKSNPFVWVIEFQKITPKQMATTAASHSPTGSGT